MAEDEIVFCVECKLRKGRFSFQDSGPYCRDCCIKVNDKFFDALWRRLGNRWAFQMPK